MQRHSQCSGLSVERSTGLIRVGGPRPARARREQHEQDVDALHEHQNCEQAAVRIAVRAFKIVFITIMSRCGTGLLFRMLSQTMVLLVKPLSLVKYHMEMAMATTIWPRAMMNWEVQ